MLIVICCFFADKMNPAQEHLTKTATSNLKKAQKGAKSSPLDTGMAPQSGSGASSTGPAARALSHL